jgi:hypothetical protein
VAVPYRRAVTSAGKAQPERATFDPDSATLQLADGTRRQADDELLVLHEEDLDVLLASDLRRALAAPSWVESARASRTPLVHFDPEHAIVEPVAYRVAGTQLQIHIEFEQDAWDDDDDTNTSRVRELLASLGRRHRFKIAQAGPNPYRQQGPPYAWEATLIPVVGNRTLGELQRAADEAVALLNAAASGQLTRTSALELLRAGRSDALIGQPEGAWLDVKRDHYDLSTTGGKVALCQAVARFANSELGGIVVVGMEAKKIPGGEEIRRLSPVPHDLRMLRRYQSAVEQHLFPAPDNLDLERLDVPGGMLIVLHLPPQGEELKPFLVHGAIVDGRTEGAFISIVRRRGESSIPVTAPAVHATLAAGRALLRRGQLPPEQGRERCVPEPGPASEP